MPDRSPWGELWSEEWWLAVGTFALLWVVPAIVFLVWAGHTLLKGLG